MYFYFLELFTRSQQLNLTRRKGVLVREPPFSGRRRFVSCEARSSMWPTTQNFDTSCKTKAVLRSRVL